MVYFTVTYLHLLVITSLSLLATLGSAAEKTNNLHHVVRTSNQSGWLAFLVVPCQRHTNRVKCSAKAPLDMASP